MPSLLSDILERFEAGPSASVRGRLAGLTDCSGVLKVSCPTRCVTPESPLLSSSPCLVPLPLVCAPFPFVAAPFVSEVEGGGAERAGIGRSPLSDLTRSRDLTGLSCNLSRLYGCQKVVRVDQQ